MTSNVSGDDAKKYYNIKNIFFAVIPLIYRSAPIYFVVFVSLGVFHGLSLAFRVNTSQIFFDSLSDFLNENISLNKVILFLVFFVSTQVMAQVLNGIHNFMYRIMWQKASMKLNQQINKKTSKIDPIEFENPSRHDDINKAELGSSGAIQFIFTICTIFTFYLPYFIYMAIYTYLINPILIISILLCFIPTLISQLLKAPLSAKLEDNVAPIRRQSNFYKTILFDKNYYLDTYLLGTFSHFKNKYIESINSLNKEIWRFERKTNKINLILQSISFLGRLGIMSLLFLLTFKGDISVGAFVAVFNSINMMFRIMEEIINTHIGAITQNMGSINNFLRFMNMHERTGEDTSLNYEKGIHLKNVSFKYPQSSINALSDITLDISKGETIAIVGKNGSGKSTLVKIISGLYIPSTGSVEVGGYNTKEISMSSINDDLSGIFQNYQKYKFTLYDNIHIADFKSHTNPINILQECEIDYSNIDIFPDGINTILSPDFEGVDLSIGQWQKIAIARGFYKKHSFILLDEPTASIDPIEENKVYNQISRIAKNKTTLIVTHRMASTKIADRVIVMDNGRIVEVGSHSELMKTEGLYKNMYEEQSKWYN